MASLLGQSIGIISLGKKLVLIEGEESSLDKQTYGAVLKDQFPEFVLVPVGGKHTIRSFGAVQEGVLNKTIWGVEFFLLADRDASYQLGIGSIQHNASSQVRLLPRYHIENYFLDEFVLARAFADLEPEGHWLRDPIQVRNRLRGIARELVPYAVALSTAAMTREAVGNVDLMAKGVGAARTVDELVGLLASKATSEGDRVSVALQTSTIEKVAREEHRRLSESIENDTPNWCLDIPGRVMLNKFASVAQINVGRLKRIYLGAASQSDRDPFADVRNIFEAFRAKS